MFSRRKRPADHSAKKVEQAEESLEQAKTDYDEQRRLREQERESVIRQLERVEERNDITGILADIFGARGK